MLMLLQIVYTLAELVIRGICDVYTILNVLVRSSMSAGSSSCPVCALLEHGKSRMHFAQLKM